MQPGTEAGWNHLDRADVRARLFAVTHLDREATSFQRIVDALRARFGTRVVALAVPFAGETIDLLSADAASRSEEAAAARDQLLEAAAESSDALLDQYLEGRESGEGTLREAVRGEISIVHAQAPLATVQRYASDLRAVSHGRGSFRIRFDHYAPVPAQEQERVLATQGAW